MRRFRAGHRTAPVTPEAIWVEPGWDSSSFLFDIVGGFCFGRRGVADGLEKPAIVDPVNLRLIDVRSASPRLPK